MPRIVYVSWPPREISGGIKAMFQHVELLAEAGVSAVVATENAGRADWFDSKAQVIGLEAIGAQDILVLPENHAGFLAAFASSPQTKLVFCQNPHQAHRGLAGRGSYADYGVSGIMCASHTLMRFCARRFPGLALWYTPFHLDDFWFPADPAKTLQVAVIPRKRALEFGAIADMLAASHPEFRDTPWVVIQQAKEREVAEAMARSAVFLSLARLEAHSMTQLEAMASSCIVAGFTGVHGGNDSATAANGFWAEEDDVYGCVDQLARALRLAKAGGDPYRAMLENSRRTAAQFRRSEVEAVLVAFWERVLSR
ncbi:MAG: hypothetical protein JWQ07_2838 [Ramlibacter sp.]|nr:hypothetical protein [Ramlibacter sp.]